MLLTLNLNFNLNLNFILFLNPNFSQWYQTKITPSPSHSLRKLSQPVSSFRKQIRNINQMGILLTTKLAHHKTNVIITLLCTINIIRVFCSLRRLLN
mmetsp:Transcript_16104/g.22240  ORF Transcript_16104/g.22240 Transcript_16104/m.22240 type:complete len:97 (-) Transcript_16104:563-853(-)